MKAFIVAEKPDVLKELSDAACQLGYRVEVLVFGDVVAGAKEIDFADKIWLIQSDDAEMLEDYTESIAALVNSEKPDLVLMQSSKRCRLIAGRLAALLGTSAMTDVTDISLDGEVKRMVYGGTAICAENAVISPAVVTVGAGILGEIDEPIKHIAQVDKAHFVEPKQKMKCVKRERKSVVSVDLSAAKRVIGVGRGIANEEDLAMVREFAQSIDAEVGCTRPIAEGEKWMPKETYIGVSGLMLVPELYFALGVSGQIQHMVGVNRAKVVIAVNKDKNAVMFKQADYGIVADLYKVLPALIDHFG